MNQSGRVSIVALGALVSVAIVAVIFIFGKESPTTAGDRFMTALEFHDVDTLTKMSMMPGLSDDQIKKEWETSVNVAGKYYLFGFHVVGGSQSGPNNAAVRMEIIKDFGKPGSYEESFQLPMVLVDGKWKVDVRGTSHDFYPGFPR